MPAALSVRTVFSARELRRLAAATRNANQSRRLLSVAAVLDGINRTEAARIGGICREAIDFTVYCGPAALSKCGRSR
jgi:hypothetical protein